MDSLPVELSGKPLVLYIFNLIRGFLGSTSGRNPPGNTGDIRGAGLIPGLGKSPGGGHGNPLQYSCLGESYGQRSLEGYSPQGRKKLDTTKVA